MDIIIVVALILAALLLIGLAAAWANGIGKTKAYLRLLLWKARGAKTAPEIPAGAIAVEHPDAALARQAHLERIAMARARAMAQTTPPESTTELSEGDEIVLLDEDDEPEAPSDRKVGDGQG